MVIFVLVLVSDLLEGIEQLIPSFRGVKFSGTDLMDFGQCVSYSQSHWSVLYGVDEVSLLQLAIWFVPKRFVTKTYLIIFSF